MKIHLFLLNEVVKSKQSLFQSGNLGFIHGVMNTDNMSISGETIDYNFAFMDIYNLKQYLVQLIFMVDMLMKINLKWQHGILRFAETFLYYNNEKKL